MDHKTDRQTIKVMTDGQTETDRLTARKINRPISLFLHTLSNNKFDCFSIVNNIP